MRRLAAGLLTVLLVSSAGVAADEDGRATPASVWVEGEAPTRGVGHPHPWYSAAVDVRRLSGGAFLSSYGADRDTEVEYDVGMPAAGAYELWARVNPIASVLEWRAGEGGPWHRADMSSAVDRVNIAADGKPDMRYLAWVRLGRVRAARGTLRVAFAFRSPKGHHGALDCFVLTRDAFAPRGRRRPGESLADTEPGFFAFDPPPDPFRDGALLDLRHLNEERAGQSGPLRARGDDIVLGDGTPVRFWGVDHGRLGSPADTEHLARRLAKCGVNLVRIHGPVHDRRSRDPRPVSRARVAAVQHAVASFAEQGVYSALSVWFPLWYELRPGDGVVGGNVGAKPFALLFIEPQVRELWKETVTKLLTAENAYGPPLAEDPAVGFFELQNEDSLLFWTCTEQRLGPGPWARLERLFAAWVRKRHGGVAPALARWDGAGHDHDAADGSRLGVFEPWHLTRDGLRDASPGLRRRLGEQLRFLAELQRDTYRELAQHVRDLGFHGLIVPGNWQTADDAALLGVERWTYAASGDVVDRHGYFSGEHRGDGASYSVRVGHRFTDRSALEDPAGARVGMVQISGRPHIQSEVSWSRPNRLRAEAPLLLAAYGALQGIDGWMHFAVRAPDWNADPGAKWPLQVPSGLGQSPAAALLFRRGDVRPAPVVRRYETSERRLFAPGAGGIVEGASTDARAAAAAGGAAAGRDPLAWLRGRVELHIAGLSPPLAALPDAVVVTDDVLEASTRERRVRSVTGELTLDWGAALLIVDTPRSQAVAGRLRAAGDLALHDVGIRCGNEYAAVHVVSLDDEPLRRSRRILVQAFTRERLFGFRAEGGAIVDLGCPPLNVERIDAEIRLPPGDWTATRLDANGYAAGSVRVRDGRVVLPPDALHVVLVR